MRKVISWVLLGLGAFLLATAVLATVWAPGVMKKTPLDVNTTTYLEGDAEKINLTEGGTDEFPVRVTSVTKTDSEVSTDSVAVFQNTTCVVNNETGGAPDCVENDERLVTASEDVFATDRKTALAVENQEKYVPDAVEEREGLVNKWPFDAEKRDYPYWDGLLGRAVKAEYTGSEKLDGLEVYTYQVSIEEEAAEVTEGIQGVYSSDKTIYVEPKTGAIVNQEQREVRTLKDGTKLIDLQVAFTDDQVESDVKDAKDNAGTLDLIGSTVPLVGFILGPILLIVGALLLMRDRRAQA